VDDAPCVVLRSRNEVGEECVQEVCSGFHPSLPGSSDSERRIISTSAVRTLATRVLQESIRVVPSVRKNVVIGPSC